MLLIGVTGFTLASVVCGMSPGPEVLILARFIQGAGAALMFPQTLSLIQATFTPEARALPFALFSAIQGASAIVGQILGGLLVSINAFGLAWRSVFLINIPIGVLALVGVLLFVKEAKHDAGTGLDLPGVGLVTMSLLLFIYPLVQGRQEGWPLWSLLALVATLPVLVCFVLYERFRSKQGKAVLMEVSLFRVSNFVLGLRLTFLVFAGITSHYLILGLFLQVGLGRSALETGLTFTPNSVGFIVGSFGLLGSQIPTGAVLALAHAYSNAYATSLFYPIGLNLLAFIFARVLAHIRK